VTVENNVLTLEGVATLDVPDGYESVGREYGVGRYRRDFTLSDDVSPQGIKARVSHGVLAVTIPKREEVKTRTIAIEA
jgi:HSP20 family protein